MRRRGATTRVVRRGMALALQLRATPDVAGPASAVAGARPVRLPAVTLGAVRRLARGSRLLTALLARLFRRRSVVGPVGELLQLHQRVQVAGRAGAAGEALGIIEVGATRHQVGM